MVPMAPVSRVDCLPRPKRNHAVTASNGMASSRPNRNTRQPLRPAQYVSTLLNMAATLATKIVTKSSSPGSFRNSHHPRRRCVTCFLAGVAAWPISMDQPDLKKRR